MFSCIFHATLYASRLFYLSISSCASGFAPTRRASKRRFIPRAADFVPLAGKSPSASNRLAIVQAALPIERLPDDLGKVVALRPPAKRGANPVGLGDDRRRIAGPASHQIDLEVDARHFLDHLGDFEHRIAAAIAAIDGQALAAGA